MLFISIDILGFSEVQAESLTASLVDIITSSVRSVANSTVSKIDQVKKIQFMSWAVSTYKFSKLIFIHFLKQWIDRIWFKFKAFSLRFLIFQMVTGHNYQPQKFLLAGYISFLASQNIGNKVNSSLCLKGNKNLRFTSEDLDVDLWMRVYVSGQHDLQTKFLARQVNCYSGWTLSVDWLFFWALMSVTSWEFANSYQGAKKTFLQLPILASWS